MSKKHFIALADTIIAHNQAGVRTPFTEDQIATLAWFCEKQSNNFNHSRWKQYIAGECGPNGGAVKKSS